MTDATDRRTDATDVTDWRTDATDRTLRVLYQSGIAVSPAGIAANLAALTRDPPGEAEVEGAIEALRDRDLVRALPEDTGFYRLTDHGRDFVESEIDSEAFGYVD